MNSQKGMGLVEVMVATSILAVVSAGVATLMKQTSDQAVQMRAQSALDSTSNALRQLVESATLQPINRLMLSVGSPLNSSLWTCNNARTAAACSGGTWDGMVIVNPNGSTTQHWAGPPTGGTDQVFMNFDGAKCVGSGGACPIAQFPIIVAAQSRVTWNTAVVPNAPRVDVSFCLYTRDSTFRNPIAFAFPAPDTTMVTNRLPACDGFPLGSGASRLSALRPVGPLGGGGSASFNLTGATSCQGPNQAVIEVTATGVVCAQQARLNDLCDPGEVIKGYNADGTKNCGRQVALTTCPANQVVKGYNADGSPNCAYPVDTTACSAGKVLQGYNWSDGSKICVDPVQYGSCPANQVVKGYNADGSPNCAYPVDSSACPAGQVLQGYNWSDGSKICVSPGLTGSCPVGQAIQGYDASGARICTDSIENATVANRAKGLIVTDEHFEQENDGAEVCFTVPGNLCFLTNVEPLNASSPAESDCQVHRSSDTSFGVCHKKSKCGVRCITYQ